MKGSIEMRVDKAPEEVFQFVANLENAPQWVPDLVSVTKTTDGEIGVGTKYHEVVQMGKSQGEAELEVTEYSPPHIFAHKGVGGPSRFTARFIIEPDGDGTKLTHEYSVRMTGLFWLMTPFVNRWVRKNSQAGIENLKQILADL